MTRLHSVAGSRSFRVLWLLHELNIPVEVVPYQIMGPTLHTDAFKALSPARRVPVLEYQGQTWCESGAIVQLLCEAHPEAGLMPAPGSAERGAWLMWLNYAETLTAGIQNLNMQHLFISKDQQSVTVMGIETKRLAIAMKSIETAVQDRDTLLPSGFSGADIMMGFTLEAAFHYIHAEKFPKTVAYMQRLAAREAYQSALQAEGPQQFYDRDFYPLPEASS